MPPPPPPTGEACCSIVDYYHHCSNMKAGQMRQMLVGISCNGLGRLAPTKKGGRKVKEDDDWPRFVPR